MYSTKRPATGPSDRARQQFGDVPIQVLVGRNADGVVHTALFEYLVDFGFGKGRVGPHHFLPVLLLPLDLGQKMLA